MDIWQKMYEEAKKQYHPEELSPFVVAHHVVCALEGEDGKIYTGFCIEAASGVMNLCAERVALLNMIQNGVKVAKKMIAFRNEPPKENGGMPCGACREFFLQLSDKNKDMEIMTDFETRKTIKLEELIPHWWGWKRYNK